MRPALKPEGSKEIQEVSAAAIVMPEASACSKDLNTGWASLKCTMRSSPKTRVT